MAAQSWRRHTCVIWVLALLLTCRIAADNGTCKKVRFATYNTSLNRNKAGELLRELQSGVSAQAANVSAILQTIRPDVVLLNEFDYNDEPEYAAVKAFQEKFLGVAQAPNLQPLRYPYAYTAPVNTGVPSGRDFNHDGRTDGPDDAFGYGLHPGQYGMVLLSMFPIDAAAARTFQKFLYKDMPGALLPTDPKTGQPWYSQDDLKVLRLSSKSHWDVPVDIPLGHGLSRQVHMLVHHPTPPVFDGKEGRNLRRNHDEIRLMANIVGCSRCTGNSVQQQGSNECDASYMYDDAGKRGGLEAGASFVIAGDHNADPLDGDSYNHAINQLLQCPNITANFTPTSEGGREAGNKKASDRTPPETKTSTFDLRVDYVLPSRDLTVVGGAVFWPRKAESPQSEWVEASDHRPVWLDVNVCQSPSW